MAEQVLIKSKRRPVGEWRPLFLSALKASGNVRLACHAAGITRVTAFKHREMSPAFAADWDLCVEDAIDLLEALAWKRAKSGSDSMIIFLLKSLRRERYGEKSTVEHKISAAARKEVQRLAVEEGLDPDEVMAEVERHLRAGAR